MNAPTMLQRAELHLAYADAALERAQDAEARKTAQDAQALARVGVLAAKLLTGCAPMDPQPAKTVSNPELYTRAVHLVGRGEALVQLAYEGAQQALEAAQANPRDAYAWHTATWRHGTLNRAEAAHMEAQVLLCNAVSWDMSGVSAK